MTHPGSDAARMNSADGYFRLLVDAITDHAISFLDPDGRIRSWNPSARGILGYGPEEIIDRHFSCLYPQEAADAGAPEQELRTAAREGRFETEGWRVRKDGSRFLAHVVLTALRDADGKLVGFSSVTRDATAHHEQEDMLRQSEERFRLLVDSVREYAIFMLDAQGNVNSWNPGAERIKGYSVSEIIGQHFSRFFLPEDVARGKPEQELAEAIRYGSIAARGWRVRKDGSRFWADVVITALYERNGTLRGFAKITRDLTERKQIEALEEASRRAHEFLAMLSHELRNPLAPLRNVAEILRTGDLQPEKLQWARDVIERQVTHLARLVDDLLDVSRITSGRIEILREVVDVDTIVDRALESVQPLLEAKDQSFELSASAEPLKVEGDLTRLVQVLTNLLHNAVNYTPRGGHIRLIIARCGDDVEIRVRDTGSGIGPDLLPRIFDLFAQGQRSLDRSDGGLGVGLTLVRQIVSMHGGTVQAYSEGPGLGSEFIVRIPLLIAEPEGMSESGADASAAAGTGAGCCAGARRRIMVVDDNHDAALSTSLLLEFCGYEVRCAYDGPTALATAAEYRPDAILLDIGLPGMDGYEVAARLRRMPETAGVLLIAVTGYGQAEDRSRAQAAGFDHHVVKPVEPETLHALLQ